MVHHNYQKGIKVGGGIFEKRKGQQEWARMRAEVNMIKRYHIYIYIYVTAAIIMCDAC